MNAIPTTVLDQLKDAVGPKGFIADPADMEPFLTEWRDLYRGVSPLILRPASTTEVSAILKICNDTGTKVVPQGGNTSLCGGSVPFDGGDEIVLSLGRMNAVRTTDPLNDTITVEAGCVLEQVHAAADDIGRHFPLRIGSQGSCQIGGNLSTNAGGTAVLHYGNTRDLVLGLEVVLADGRVWDGLRGLRKDNTGYDLKQLFIGAEGTLGVITAAVLKLFPKPSDVQTAFVAVPTVGAAVSLLEIARQQSGDQVTAFEIIPRIGIDIVTRHIPGTVDPIAEPHPWYLLIELSSGGTEGGLRATLEAILAAGLETGLVHDATLAESGAQSEMFWRIRDGMSEAQKPEGGSIKHDISVPISRIAEFIERADAAVDAIVPGFRSIAFGHIGDGNVHYNPMQPVAADKQAFLAKWHAVSTAVHEVTAALGGSISAEHGLGRLKRDEITRFKSPLEIELMRGLKQSFDPKGILNPGKVVASA